MNFIERISPEVRRLFEMRPWLNIDERDANSLAMAIEILMADAFDKGCSHQANLYRNCPATQNSRGNTEVTADD